MEAAMNFLLRALWDRLLPPGGDVAVAVPADDREMFRLGGKPLRNCSVTFRQQPRRFSSDPPTPSDLSPDGRCWWWYGHGWLLDQPVHGLPADIPWLPYHAIADPNKIRQ